MSHIGHMSPEGAVLKEKTADRIKVPLGDSMTPEGEDKISHIGIVTPGVLTKIHRTSFMIPEENLT